MPKSLLDEVKEFVASDPDGAGYLADCFGGNKRTPLFCIATVKPDFEPLPTHFHPDYFIDPKTVSDAA